MPGTSRAEQGGKESPKRDVVISSLRYLISGCARGAELTAMAPLNLPNKWARILRMSSAPKIQIDDFLQVMRGEANWARQAVSRERGADSKSFKVSPRGGKVA